MPLLWRKPTSLSSVPFQGGSTTLPGVKSYINSPNNAAWKNNNNPPPTQDNNDPPPPSLYLGDLTFCIKFDPWKMGPTPIIHSIWGSNDHGQRKKEPGKHGQHGKISLIFFLVNFYKKKGKYHVAVESFFDLHMVLSVSTILPSKLGHSSQTLTQFPSFFFWNFNQF